MVQIERRRDGMNEHNKRWGSRCLRIHDARREDDTVRANENDGTTLDHLRLWRKTAQYFGAAYLDERRGLGAEEDVDGIRLGEVFAINSKHLRRVWIGLSQYCPRGGAVRLGLLSGTIRRKVLDHARERCYWLGGYRERPGLRGVLVVEKNGRNVKVVTNLIGANDSPDARLANVYLPKGAGSCARIATRTTTRRGN